jgi:hypothetical protein
VATFRVPQAFNCCFLEHPLNNPMITSIILAVLLTRSKKVQQFVKLNLPRVHAYLKERVKF